MYSIISSSVDFLNNLTNRQNKIHLSIILSRVAQKCDCFCIYFTYLKAQGYAQLLGLLCDTLGRISPPQDICQVAGTEINWAPSVVSARVSMELVPSVLDKRGVSSRSLQLLEQLWTY